MKKKSDDNYIPENDELEEESNNEIDIKEKQSVKAGRLDFPDVEDDYGVGGFKADIAQQVGRFSDQVQMDSPADEAGAIGRDALKDTIEASKKKLAEKEGKKNK